MTSEAAEPPWMHGLHREDTKITKTHEASWNWQGSTLETGLKPKAWSPRPTNLKSEI
jgi:hypothetical protein